MSGDLLPISLFPRLATLRFHQRSILGICLRHWMRAVALLRTERARFSVPYGTENLLGNESVLRGMN
jgi:hypothetical protein